MHQWTISDTDCHGSQNNTSKLRFNAHLPHYIPVLDCSQDSTVSVGGKGSIAHLNALFRLEVKLDPSFFVVLSTNRTCL